MLQDPPGRYRGDTPEFHRSLTAFTPSGRWVAKAGRRQEGAFVTPATPISCAPHQGSLYALRSCHKGRTPVHRKQQRTCLRPKRDPTKNSMRSAGLGSLRCTSQTGCSSRGDLREIRRTRAGASRECLVQSWRNREEDLELQLTADGRKAAFAGLMPAVGVGPPGGIPLLSDGGRADPSRQEGASL